MIEVILLAQLAGPACGWRPGVEITPYTSPVGGIGCTVPGPGPYGTRLLPDPFAPGGIRAEPAVKPLYPNEIQYGVPYQ
jgi:hypothetical protein